MIFDIMSSYLLKYKSDVVSYFLTINENVLS